MPHEVTSTRLHQSKLVLHIISDDNYFYTNYYKVIEISNYKIDYMDDDTLVSLCVPIALCTGNVYMYVVYTQWSIDGVLVNCGYRVYTLYGVQYTRYPRI